MARSKRGRRAGGQVKAVYALCAPVFGLCKVATAVTEGERHTIRYVNPAFLELTAQTDEACVGFSLEERFPELAALEPTALIDRVRRSPRAESSGDPVLYSHPLRGSLLLTLTAWPCGHAAALTIIQFVEAREGSFEDLTRDIRAVNEHLLLAGVEQHEIAQEATQRMTAAEEAASRSETEVAKAEHASAAKTIFLRNVSHEIRTPIAAMLGFARLLASPNLTAEDRTDLVRRVQSNGEAVLALLGDVLDLARLDADRVEVAAEAVFVVELARDVLSSFELETRSKGLDVRLEVVNGSFGSLRTDRYRLRQILVNLIGNAVKFTSTGGITVSVRAGSRESGDWIIDVDDTGIGIASDRQALLFEPFAQADTSITHAYGGTGLGLVLSRRLAERLGGSLILLNSAPGRGSTFRLSVKAMPGTLSLQHSPSSSDPLPAEYSIGGLRILLVEDHLDIQLAMRRLLEQEGAAVVAANDGREALASFLSESIDLVLMDLRMPNLDGVQATRALRKAGCTRPIIALTADPTALSRSEAMSAGCDDCLFKPFAVDDLMAVIRSLHNPE